jgi:hypothetical protein
VLLALLVVGAGLAAVMVLADGRVRVSSGVQITSGEAGPLGAIAPRACARTALRYLPELLRLTKRGGDVGAAFLEVGERLGFDSPQYQALVAAYSAERLQRALFGAGVRPALRLARPRALAVCRRDL